MARWRDDEVGKRSGAYGQGVWVTGKRVHDVVTKMGKTKAGRGASRFYRLQPDTWVTLLVVSNAAALLSRNMIPFHYYVSCCILDGAVSPSISVVSVSTHHAGRRGVVSVCMYAVYIGSCLKFQIHPFFLSSQSSILLDLTWPTLIAHISAYISACCDVICHCQECVHHSATHSAMNVSYTTAAAVKPPALPHIVRHCTTTKSQGPSVCKYPPPSLRLPLCAWPLNAPLSTTRSLSHKFSLPYARLPRLAFGHCTCHFATHILVPFLLILFPAALHPRCNSVVGLPPLHFSNRIVSVLEYPTTSSLISLLPIVLYLSFMSINSNSLQLSSTF